MNHMNKPTESNGAQLNCSYIPLYTPFFRVLWEFPAFLASMGFR